VFNANNSTFAPYKFSGGGEKSFEKIIYIGAESHVKTKTIAKYWDQLKSGTIGDDTLSSIHAILQRWKRPGTTAFRRLQFSPDLGLCITIKSTDKSVDIGYEPYVNGVPIPVRISDGTIGLKTGNNRIGIYVSAAYTAKDLPVTREAIDFVYIDVVYNPLSIDLNMRRRKQDGTYFSGPEEVMSKRATCLSGRSTVK